MGFKGAGGETTDETEEENEKPETGNSRAHAPGVTGFRFSVSHSLPDP